MGWSGSDSPPTTRRVKKALLAGDIACRKHLLFFFAFVAVLALIGLAAWLVRRFATNRLGANTNRGRMPRLAVIDAAAVDGRRRLVLVRRDNVEHLLMIGGPTDIVVEANIVRAMPGRDPMAQRPAVGSTEPPPRIAPLPDTGWSDGEGARTDMFDHAEPQMPEPPPRPVRPSFADEVRRPAPPPMPERRPERAERIDRDRDPLAGFAPEPMGGRPEPRPELRPEPMPSRVDLAQRADDAASAASRTAEGAAAARARTGRRTAAAAAPPPPRPGPVQRRPESRRDGATAGSSPATAGRRNRGASGRARTAASPRRAAQRADAAGAGRRRPRRAALRISKTRWRPCWAVQRTLREAGGLPA